MIRLRATVVVEYDANPADYGTEDPVRMAEIDAENWAEDPTGLLATFDGEDFVVKVEATTNQGAA